MPPPAGPGEARGRAGERLARKLVVFPGGRDLHELSRFPDAVEVGARPRHRVRVHLHGVGAERTNRSRAIERRMRHRDAGAVSLVDPRSLDVDRRADQGVPHLVGGDAASADFMSAAMAAAWGAAAEVPKRGLKPGAAQAHAVCGRDVGLLPHDAARRGAVTRRDLRAVGAQNDPSGTVGRERLAELAWVGRAPGTARWARRARTGQPPGLRRH